VTNRIHDAIVFAARKHDGQVRKGTDIPYIAHPMEVMWILMASDQWNDEVLIAGILHDVLEDTDATEDEVKEKFGDRVLHIIQQESEDKSKSWKDRKQAAIDHLAGADDEVKAVCCADKLSNLLSMYADKQECGEVLWKRFNASKEDIHWYYDGIAEKLKNTLSEYTMFKDLTLLIDMVFN
jgi:(p)ppGpp synthase/HD superfamily hydrolase